MNDISIEQMQQMQLRLHEKYKDSWSPLCPETAKDRLLWMMAEVGEAAQIIKKDGDTAIMEDPEVRAHFVEEMADVLMYFNDVLISYGITPGEVGGEYVKKFERNLNRW